MNYIHANNEEIYTVLKKFLIKARNMEDYTQPESKYIYEPVSCTEDMHDHEFGRYAVAKTTEGVYLLANVMVLLTDIRYYDVIRDLYQRKTVNEKKLWSILTCKETVAEFDGVTDSLPETRRIISNKSKKSLAKKLFVSESALARDKPKYDDLELDRWTLRRAYFEVCKCLKKEKHMNN